jgi:PAS domain S-box-containing protein
MPLNTVWTFILLCFGILYVQSQEDFMYLLTSDRSSGLSARRLLIAALLLPFMTGLLIFKGYQAQFYDAAFAITLFAIIFIAMFVVFSWRSTLAMENLILQLDHANKLRQYAQAALQANEEKLQIFVNANLIGIMFGDIYGGIQQANDEFLRMVGYTQADVAAGRLTWRDLTPAELLYLDEQSITQARASEKGACVPYEKEYICKDGSRIPVLVGFVLLGAEQEEAVAFILDLSAQKAALRERQQAQEKILQLNKDLQRRVSELQTLLDVIPIGIGIAEDPECLNIKTNPAFAKQLKLLPEQNASLTAPSPDRVAGFQVYREGRELTGTELPMQYSAAYGVELLDYEVDVVHPDGTVVNLLEYVTPLFDEEGKTRGCIGAFLDITERKQVEKALSLGYKNLQLLFNTANNLLSTQQPTALIDSVFQQLSEQIGLDIYFNYLVENDSQVMRLASYHGFSAEIAQQIEWLEFGQAVCGTAAQTRQVIHVENVQQSTDPKTELIRSFGINAYYCYPLIAQGKLLGTLSFGSYSLSQFTPNQTAIMQAVCDQIAIAMERAILIASLQEQTEHLRQANRMKDEFLGILSHELRSPLNAILGWAQLLRTRKFGEAQMEKGLETIERNARAQTQLVEDLLDISRMIRGKLQMNVGTCDLVTIITAAIDTVSLAAQAKEIDLRFSLGSNPHLETQDLLSLEPTPQTCGDVPRVTSDAGQLNHQFLLTGDSDRLQQIIWNLLANAIKFTPQGGKVEVKLCQVVTHSQEVINHQQQKLVTQSAQIQVIDTGIGISPDFLPYVFDRFRQADSSSTRNHGGLGLGLALVRYLTELHGGSVDVYSGGENHGATFTVKLPLNQFLIDNS